MLRLIYGPGVENESYRIMNNKKLRILYKKLDEVADIRRIMLQWVRMEETRLMKTVLDGKPGESTRVLRSTLRWLQKRI